MKNSFYLVCSSVFFCSPGTGQLFLSQVLIPSAGSITPKRINHPTIIRIGSRMLFTSMILPFTILSFIVSRVASRMVSYPTTVFVGLSFDMSFSVHTEGPLNLLTKLSVNFEHASVHHHREALFGGFNSGGMIYDPLLHPEHFCPNFDGFVY